MNIDIVNGLVEALKGASPESFEPTLVGSFKSLAKAYTDSHNGCISIYWGYGSGLCASLQAGAENTDIEKGDLLDALLPNVGKFGRMIGMGPDDLAELKKEYERFLLEQTKGKPVAFYFNFETGAYNFLSTDKDGAPEVVALSSLVNLGGLIDLLLAAAAKDKTPEKE